MNFYNVSITPRALESMGEFSAEDLLERHFNGDYGDVTKSEMLDNDLALYTKQGICRSVYKTTTGIIVMVTRWNQTFTFVHVPEEKDSVLDGEKFARRNSDPVPH